MADERLEQLLAGKKQTWTRRSALQMHAARRGNAGGGLKRGRAYAVFSCASAMAAEMI